MSSSTKAGDGPGSEREAEDERAGEDEDLAGDVGPPRTVHDSFFKEVFGDPVRAAGELRAILPERISRHIDWNTLVPTHASVVRSNLRQAHGDLLFHVHLHDKRSAYLWLLFEHQSTVDRWMAQRTSDLTQVFWQRWLKQNPDALLLPAVLPLVLYHGPTRWEAATSLLELIDLSDEAKRDFQPFLLSGGFLLDDLRATSDDDLAARDMAPYAKLALVLFKHGPEPELRTSLVPFLHELRALLAGDDKVKMWDGLVTYTVAVNPYIEDVEALIRQLRLTDPEVADTMISIAESIEKRGFEDGRKSGLEDGRKSGLEDGRKSGLEDGRKSGLEDGRKSGRRETLLVLLEHRFGAVPQEVVSLVEKAGTAQLDTWTRAILTAQSLAELFPSVENPTG